MNVSDGEFYLTRLPDGDSIHDERGDAISALREHAGDLDPESEDVSVVSVSIDGDDWTITEIAWQSIALELLGGES